MINLEEEFKPGELEIYKKMPEAAFTDLKERIERINYMSEQELISKLKKFHLNTHGGDNALRTRLKNSYKQIILDGKDLLVSSEILPYFVIIDFEATCEEVNPPNYRHEIIEFPAVIVNSRKQEIVDYFQMYCRPQINPKISKFCTDLTGITQEQVDSAETFDKVFEHFNIWLRRHNLGGKNKYAIVTDGPWDMCRFLYSQCKYSKVKFPKWGKRWINLRKTFSKFYQCEKFCLKNMLEFLDMEFLGRPHCGLDDARNISRILLKMIYDGANIVINEGLSPATLSKDKLQMGSDCVDLSNTNCKGDIDIKSLPKKIEARFVTVRSLEKMPVYKKTKRERHIGECQIAKKIFKNSELGEKEVFFNKKSPKYY